MGRNTSTSGHKDGVVVHVHDVLLLLFLLALCFASDVRARKTTTHPDEVKALRAVKSSLNDPDNNLISWNKGDPCNSYWTGVSCSDDPRYDQLDDDGFLHLSKLKLMYMNLSGTLSPALGNLSQLQILNVMCNDIGGSIPPEIGSLKNLEILILGGNRLTGSLPDELGNLGNLRRMHIDVNNISGPLPKSFANLSTLKHLHLNNNSISGEIPRELSTLSTLLHFALDNNNLSGSLPAEISKMQELVLLQLDNNNFSGSEIPTSYGSMTSLVKLSLRNCGLKGSVPDLSGITNLRYIDLSLNQLSGPIPSEKLPDSMTAVILSNNSLTGAIPAYFSTLPRLQKLSLDYNLLSGSVESSLWQSRSLTSCEKLTLDFRKNYLAEIVGNSRVPAHVTLLLEGNNLLCANKSIAVLYCRTLPPEVNAQDTSLRNPISSCTSQRSQICNLPFEYINTTLASRCYCAAPFIVKYRLESPGFADFCPYQKDFREFVASNLNLKAHQLNINSAVWQEGPRLEMVLKLFPVYNKAGKKHIFNKSEVQQVWSVFTEYKFMPNGTFGPYNTLLLGPYSAESPISGISKGVLVAIILGVILVSAAISTTLSFLYINMRLRRYFGADNRNTSSIRNMVPIEVEGVRRFTYKEMALATSNFCCSVEIGQGGYGKVYKGVLAGGALVAIKRAQEGSLQGNTEFRTEIKMLSRVHHRHLVSLVGYCDDRDEQMLVYEFIPNGTLKDHISDKSLQPLSFATRLRIALGSARGILYLHSEADPPIFHRDVKATNILLDSKFTAKVADFGLSRLAPEADNDGIVATHVSTVVKGTPGYLDPQYFLTHKLTDKSDVYGLGVVFLELLTGMQPISFGKILVREVNTAYQSGNIFSVVDERMGDYPRDCAERLAVLALGCCHEENTARPTMAEVVRELEAIEQMTPEPDTSSTTESSCIKLSKRDSASSSSSAVKYPFGSVDLSGSDLVSGTMPYASPR